MKLVIEAIDLEHALYCIQQGVDAIIIGNNKFALRNSFDFRNEIMQSIIKQKRNTLIFIKVNAFFFEHDLIALTKYLKTIAKWNIDGVIFSDYAVAQINDELNLNLPLRYNPETLVTSYFQFDFYNEAKFKAVSLARELNLNEVNAMINAKNKNNLELEIQGHGYLFIMHSRWNLITNFEKYYDLNLQKQKLAIRENLRKLPNIISEDNHGTHMFSGYQLYTLDILDKIKNVDWIRIDTLNLDKEYVYYLTNTYHKAINYLNIDLNQYQKFINQEIKSFLKMSKIPQSHGFLGNIKDLLHLEKNDEN